MVQGEVFFKKSETARILGVTGRTLYNREQRGDYPPARRDPASNHRYYTLHDVIRLQMRSNGRVQPRPICELLYEKGYAKDARDALNMVNNTVGQIRGRHG